MQISFAIAIVCEKQHKNKFTCFWWYYLSDI